MPGYCNKNDLIKDITEKTLLQLTDDQRTGSIIDTNVVAVIEDAINDAKEEMDSYLSVRYAMPLDAVPQLKDANSQLAIWRLFRRRQLGDTDDIKARRSNTIKWLEKVRDRKANIIGIADISGNDTGASGGSIVVKQGASTNFDWGSY